MDILKKIFALIPKIVNKIPKLGEFFEDENNDFSMIRLLVFMVIGTLCFDGCWSLVILKVAWNFTVTKLGLATAVIGAKFGEKVIMNKKTVEDTEDAK